MNLTTTSTTTSAEDHPAYTMVDLILPEREDELSQAFYAIQNKRHCALWAPSSLGTTTFLKNLVERCNIWFHTSIGLYLNISDTNSLEEISDKLVNSILSTLSQNNHEMVTYVDKYLTGFTITVYTDLNENGERRITIQMSRENNPLEDIENLIRIAQAICKEKGIQLAICIDGVETTRQLPQSEEIDSLFNKHLNQKGEVSLVLATKSKRQHENFTDGNTETCKSLSLSLPSLDTVRDLLQSYLQNKCKEVPQECIDHLSQLSKTNIPIGFELADQSLLRCGDTLSIKAIDEAFTSMFNSRYSLYQNMTNARSQESRNVLKLISVGGKLQDISMLYRFNLPSYQDIIPTKESLISSGIITDNGSVCQFIDPIYEHWFRIHYHLSDQVF